MLGLFQGVPLNKKSIWQSATIPERITIFQHNVENICRTDEEIKQKIKEVIRHEVAHFVGFTEEEIRNFGY
ncbi:MAG: metallopeptidase family protein [Planctomycetia bacterium]|nr:metallopeptidase family protein [Planctomycetia bacterium]